MDASTYWKYVHFKLYSPSPGTNPAYNCDCIALRCYAGNTMKIVAMNRNAMQCDEKLFTSDAKSVFNSPYTGDVPSTCSKLNKNTYLIIYLSQSD